MEMKEVVEMIIWIVVLVILIGAAYLLISGKGGQAFDAIRNILRFGRG